ncbi:phosphatase PAP2 family protein [Alicyclobacillaceae bacterium I2511]|nr:phosphatase PAP2 family protein [Alicyclobacillaceae bacterium I2511]
MLAPDFPIPFGYRWQYIVIRWLQSWHWLGLHQGMFWLTWLGGEWFYLLVLPILFWAVSPRVGLRVAYILILSMYTNYWLKYALHFIRPLGIPGIHSDLTANSTGYAMPSGHAQGSATLWGLLAYWFKRPWFTVLAILLVLCIGVSRVYLGVHWPQDVLVGWVLGAAFAWLGWVFGRWWTYRGYRENIRLLLAVALPLALWGLHRGSADAAYASLLLGLGLGSVLQNRWFGLQMNPLWWKRGAAVIIGMAGMIALQWGIKWPVSLLWVSVVNLLIGLWGTLGAPYLFGRAGLYDKLGSTN